MNMTCSKCGSTLPDKAKFCPECGKIIELAPKCTNGHMMQPGQKFCSECGAPLAKCDDVKESATNVRSDSFKSKPSIYQKKNKGGKVLAKVIVTLIIMGIVAAVVIAIGGVPSYIAGGICMVIIPNIWKFIDDN